jgi:nicotinamidase-related amidase
LFRNAPAFQIVPELEPREGEVVVDKITMSTFEGTFLNLALRDACIDSFLMAGIALEIGIEPTVRQGPDLNYLPVVITDACGSKTEELKHRSLATFNETGEVFMASTADIVKILGERQTSPVSAHPRRNHPHLKMAKLARYGYEGNCAT